MRLLIDIPEIDYECAKQRWMMGNDAHKTDYYISNGIPLEDVKAGMERIKRFHVGTFEDDNPIDYGIVEGLDKAIAILDNIGKEGR